MASTIERAELGGEVWDLCIICYGFPPDKLEQIANVFTQHWMPAGAGMTSKRPLGMSFPLHQSFELLGYQEGVSL